MSSYQPGIPTGTVNLDVDYLNIQANFQQLDTSFGVDHVPFSNQTAQNGYHTSIHFNPVSTTVTNPPNNQPVVPPAATPGIGQLFSSQINDGYGLDEALYFLTGGSKLMQLTRNIQPVAATNGYTFLPGGLILQWGIRTSSGGTQTLTLNVPFPNNFFNFQATMIRNSSNVDTIYGVTGPTAGVVSAIQFRDTSSGNPFFWYALGN